MTTSIRPEISRRNAYHISRHRYYELKHFCLQYREWGRAEARNKELVKAACVEADPSIASWIFRAVTEGVSYTYLKTALSMPCSKSMYYDRYRKFFWLLDIHQRKDLENTHEKRLSYRCDDCPNRRFGCSDSHICPKAD